MKKKTMRQLLSGVMAAVLLLGNLSISAGAASADPAPVPLTEPKVELQGNVVKDQFGKLTGFFELSIRVQTMTNQTMKSIMMALEYDPTVLEPVTWDAAANEAGLVPTISLGSGDYTTQLPAKKMDNTTGAVALTGAAQEAGAKGTEGKSLLYFRAESQKSVELSQMTTLAVIRFHVETTEMIKFTLSDDGKLQYDGADGVLTKFVNFAPDAAAADSPALRTLHCSCNDKEYALAAADKFAVLSPDSVSLTLVSEESFVKTGIDLNKVCVITYTDWDNSILGTQVVPQNADVRKMVNDYVKTNFIHTDLQSNTNYASLARTDNYRGKYPHSGPALLGTQTDTADAKPLTGKLDYVFLKRPMEFDAGTGKWVQKKDTLGAPAVDSAYPYTHGWALCASSGDAENIWTTLGSTGELSDYAVGADGASFTYNGTQPFQLADFKAGVGNAKQIFVKAIYEPGADLLDESYPYRMIKNPYYSKQNSLPATAGGAYSVSFAYERASTSSGNLLKGVTRVHSAAVRQDTTADAKEYKQANVTDPTDKTKTSYVKVAVENGETVDVELLLSARHNMVDYYLVDLYDANVVGGTRRSERNGAQTAPVPDNYTYSGAANEYETRQGTAGFVTQGTLNSLMEVLTKKVKGTDKNNDFSAYVSKNTIDDLNFRADSSGAFYTDLSFITLNATAKIEAMAQAAYSAHQIGDNQWWDTERDQMSVSWHQFQLYLTDNTLYSDATSEPPGKLVTWCRLHTDCTSVGGSKPTNWEELLDKAKNSPDDLDGLTLPDIEAFNLRADEKGTEYVQPADFKTDVVAAVNAYPNAVTATNPTWDEVQYYLDKGGYPATLGDATQYAKDWYWWYNNVAKPVNWIGTVAAANTANTVGREALLNTLQDAYDKLTTATTDETDWIKLTENLAKDNQGVTFDSFAAFKTALKEAVAAAVAGGIGDLTTLTWGQVQYHAFHSADPGYTFPVTPDMNQQAEISSYWWHNGGKKVTDLKSLLDAARKANQGNSASLDALTTAEVYTYTQLRFAKNFKGEHYADDTELAAFKTAVKQLVANEGIDLQWEDVQYYMIHNAFDATAAVNEGGNYYWWKNGGAGMAVTLTAASEDTTILRMIEAAFRAEVNGNVNAWNNLTTTILKSGWIAKNDDGSSNYTLLPKFSAAELETVKTQMNNLILQATPTGSYAPPALTWYQVQHFLAIGEYVSDPTDPKLSSTIYWWKGTENNPNAGPPETKLTPVVKDMVSYCSTAMTETAFKASITLPVVNDLVLKRTWNGTTAAGFSGLNLATAKTRLTALANAAYNTSTQSISLTWYQVQDFVLTGGPLKSAADAKAEAIAAGWNWVPTEWADNVETATAPVTFSLFSLESEPEETVEETPPQTETDPETGAVTETSAVTTTVKEVDGLKRVVTVTATTVTTNKRTLSGERGSTVTTTVNTTVNTLMVDLITGKTESHTVVKPAVVTEVFTPVEQPEETMPPVEETAPPIEETTPPTEESKPPEEETMPPAEEEKDPTAPPQDDAETLPPMGDVGTPPSTDETTPPTENSSGETALVALPLRGSGVAMAIQPYGSGALFKSHTGGRASSTWAAPPWSLRLIWFQQSDRLLAGMPAIARLHTSRGGTTPLYGPIVGIRTGT